MKLPLFCYGNLFDSHLLGRAFRFLSMCIFMLVASLVSQIAVRKQYDVYIRRRSSLLVLLLLPLEL